jgi:hypothetical protein
MAPLLTAAEHRNDQRAVAPRPAQQERGSPPTPQSRPPVASDGLETLRSSHC